MHNRKVNVYHKEEKSQLIIQSQILNQDFSQLLSLYFLCEKLGKKLTQNCDDSNKSLYLSNLKKCLIKEGLLVSDFDLNRIFLTSLDKKDKKSFRVIRNKVCHSCSIHYRDFAIKHKNEYIKSMHVFLNELFKIFSY